MIDKIGHYSLTNSSSVYDEEAMTALELAGRTAGKVNEVIDELGKMPGEIDKALDKKIGDGTFDEAIEKHMGQLDEELKAVEKKVDNIFTNVPPGGTTLDAEVVDMRLTHRGEVKGSAGDAMRDSFMGVENTFSSVKGVNLFNYEESSVGMLNPSDGVTLTRESGQINAICSGYIPVTPGEVYSAQIDIPVNPTDSFSHVVVCFYSSGKVFKNGLSFWDTEHLNSCLHSFKIPSGVLFMRVSYRHFMGAEFALVRGLSKVGIEPLNIGTDDNIVEAVPCFGGYYDDNGRLVNQTASKEFATSAIPVTPGQVLSVEYQADNPYLNILYMDKGQKPVGTMTRIYSSTRMALTVPSGCYHIAFSFRRPEGTFLGVYKNQSNARKMMFDFARMDDPLKDPVTYIAHGGGSVYAPENTMPCFEKYIELGFKVLECDVRFTADSEPVCLHDATINRTARVKGSGAELSSPVRVDSLHMLTINNQFDFGVWWGSEYEDTPIPKVEEFLKLCRSKGCHAVLELKTGTNDQIHHLVLLVKWLGMLRNVTWISFDEELLKVVLTYDRFAHVGLITNTLTQEDVQKVIALPAIVKPFLNSGAYSDTSSEAELAIRDAYLNDIPIGFWTVDEDGMVEEILSRNCPVKMVTRNKFTSMIKNVIFDSSGNELYEITCPEGMTWSQFVNSEYCSFMAEESHEYILIDGCNVYVNGMFELQGTHLVMPEDEYQLV